MDIKEKDRNVKKDYLAGFSRSGLGGADDFRSILLICGYTINNRE